MHRFREPDFDFWPSIYKAQLVTRHPRLRSEMTSEQNLDRLQSGIDGKVWVEYVGEVAIIRLDCGENRFNKHFLGGLHRCLDEILQRPDIHGVVTVGCGKFYSNGIDLAWMKAIGSISMDDITSVTKLWSYTLQRILLFPLPTVAAINGHAFAAGALLAMCHDYRVMQTDRGWFSINEVHLGLRLPEWLIKLVTFKAPGSRVQTDVISFGKRLVAKDALDLGLVQKTTTSEALLREAITMVKDSYKGTPGLQREMLKKMKEDTYAEIVKVSSDGPRDPNSYMTAKM